MRGKLSIRFWIFGLCLCVAFSLSQAQESPGQSYLVIEFMVKPGKIADFETAWKERIEELKKQDYSLPIYVYSMEFPHYYAFYPVQLYSGLDDFFGAYVDIAQKIETQILQKIHEQENASIDYYKTFLLRHK